MELSQPRPYGAQGAKPTHDFLSLYSPAPQDPSPSIPGGYVTTHDFLQRPLEQVEKEGNKVDHIMGTYNVGQISSSYMNQIDMNKIETKKVPKAEGVVVISGAQSSSSNNNDENSNCSSYTGSGFTIWDESNVKKGKSKTGKIGVPWMASQSSTVKFDTGKSTPGQQPNSPRSKHSATEQRRRSKINDRFTMLRGIMPHGDEKRDKASFLLEVIEYIQFLQEKVHKYEDSWNNKPSNMIPMDNKTTEEPQLPNGIISISTMYSQGISSALTQALKRSGVELSKTNISVQIDVGKRSSTNPKDNETDSIEESGEGLKRLKRS